MRDRKPVDFMLDIMIVTIAVIIALMMAHSFFVFFDGDRDGYGMGTELKPDMELPLVYVLISIGLFLSGLTLGIIIERNNQKVNENV